MIVAELNSKFDLGISTEDERMGSEIAPRDISRMEDLLTSNVFGILKNLSFDAWKTFLPGILNEEEDLIDDIKFWKRFSDMKTEPDIVMQSSRCIVFIEVKYFSNFGKGDSVKDSQLLRQWELGTLLKEELKKTEFYLITLTRKKSGIEDQLRHQLGKQYEEQKVFSIYWEDIYLNLNRYINENVNQLSKIEWKFVKDVCEYLKSKGFDVTEELKDRELSYYFGDDADKFMTKLKELKSRIDNIDSKANKISIPLYKCGKEDLRTIIDAINILFNSDKISTSPIQNTFEIDVLKNFLVEPDENLSRFFSELMLTAIHKDNLRLNGKSDFSVKAKISDRNQEISLFTVYKNQNEPTIVFQLRR